MKLVIKDSKSDLACYEVYFVLYDSLTKTEKVFEANENDINKRVEVNLVK